MKAVFCMCHGFCALALLEIATAVPIYRSPVCDWTEEQKATPHPEEAEAIRGFSKGGSLSALAAGESLWPK